MHLARPALSQLGSLVQAALAGHCNRIERL
jgi:hypothetical protein